MATRAPTDGRASSGQAGYAWLLNYFGLEAARSSSLAVTGRRSAALALPGQTALHFASGYRPRDTVPAHIAFALKYEPMQLDVLAEVFKRIDARELAQHIAATPAGREARVMGFLFEWCNARELPLDCEPRGAYVPVLAQQRYLVPKAGRRVSRWRVLDNLPGTREFCPIVRRTVELESFLHIDFPARIQSYRRSADPQLFERAIQYLYQRETRSSFAIEHETLSPGRAGLFVRALGRAGREPELLTEAGLLALQQTILDPRFVESGFRRRQNYVGETLPHYRERVHYVCPPPQFVPSLMRGLAALPVTAAGIEPLAEAAMLSFGFVFIHPFEDGNGRIHRFLIHDALARRGVLPADVIVPVSAYMERQRERYDTVLEHFSKPLLKLARYGLDDQGVMTLHNPEELESRYRYPNLTAQAEFLGRALRESLEEDLQDEIDFLRKFDRTTRLVREVVDLPDRRLALLIRLMHEQGGRLSNAKRKTQFADINDDEITAIHSAFAEGFGTTPDLWKPAGEE